VALQSLLERCCHGFTVVGGGLQCGFHAVPLCTVHLCLLTYRLAVKYVGAGGRVC